MSDDKKYKRYADAVLAVHIFWTCVVFGGAIAMLFWPAYALTEIVVVSFTLLIGLPFGAVCPLTLLEERLRRKTDPSYRNHGSYLASYINKIFKSDISVFAVNVAVGILYALIYAAAVYRMIHP